MKTRYWNLLNGPELISEIYNCLREEIKMKFLEQ